MNRLLFAISIIVFCTVTALVLGSVAQAQNYQNIRVELQEQQKQARSNIQSMRRQIIEYEEQVSRALDEYSRNYEQYQILEREIVLRNAVIRTMDEERSAIVEELGIIQDQINDLVSDLNTIIENYKSTLTHLYKHGRVPEVVLLFTSTSINHMLVRAHYLERFTEHRQKQAQQIIAMQKELEQRESELDDARRRNQQNIAETREEQETLEERKRTQERKVAEMRRDRDRLQQRLETYRNEVESLESTLTELIEEESRIETAEMERLERLREVRQQRLASAENIRNSRERESQIARFSRPIDSPDYPDNEQLRMLETSFEEEKGRLPWPVSSNVISAQFGNRVNPVYGTRIDNPGIEIITDPGSDVNAVHDGYVFAVQPISGFGNCVFVKHGRYITVYGNMSEISVNRNTLVRKGEILGRSGDENSLKGATLFFMIREQDTNLDPEIWISNR